MTAFQDPSVDPARRNEDNANGLYSVVIHIDMELNALGTEMVDKTTPRALLRCLGLKLS